jgi:hypothetical protein
MSRMIALLVLTTLTLSLNPGAATSSATAPNDEMEVQIHFSGLMVFHLNPNTKSYEVGVLSEENSHNHEFCIQRKGASHPLCRADLPKGKRWTLAVVPAPGSASVTAPPAADVMKVGRKGRRPDDEKAQFDFDWIVDLEGPEFHNKPLELQPGQLVPIIQLPKARLFTAYKSEDFVRWKGKKPQNPELFGFVSETTGMTLRIKAGEKVVLSEDGGDEILSIPYAPPTPVGRSDEVITIANIRPDSKDGSSDFHMYYKLFKGAPIEEQYDFDLNPDLKRPRAKNPLPGYKTCCHLRCTSIFLSKWDKPLE